MSPIIKNIRNFLIVFLFISTSAMAAPASESSIRELLTVMQSQKLIVDIQDRTKSMMDEAIKNELKGRTITSKEQQAIDNMKNKMMTVLKNELSWENIEPMYIKIYSESLSEEEVAGMITFYKSPAGQAVIKKMPTLANKTIIEVNKIMLHMDPQIKKIRKEFREETNPDNQ